MHRQRGPGLVIGLLSLIVAGALLACGGDDLELPVEIAPTLPPRSPTPVSAQPTPAPTEASQPTAEVNGAQTGGQEYEVQPGDTLGAIAEQFGVTVDAIAQLNDIADPNLIQPGQVLQIPEP